MREFKIVQVNAKGKLVTDYEFFTDMDAAEAWAEQENAKSPGSVVDVEFQDVNEEYKYEYG